MRLAKALHLVWPLGVGNALITEDQAFDSNWGEDKLTRDPFGNDALFYLIGAIIYI